MPGRFVLRSSRPEGPAPFSSEWLTSDAPPPTPRTRVRLPEWVPEGRTLSAGLLVALTLVVTVLALQARGERGRMVPSTTAIVAPTGAADPLLAAAPAATTAPAAEQPPSAPVESAQPTAALAQATVPGPEFAQAPALAAQDAAAVVAPPTDGPLLPNYRIVTYYGHPHDSNMGIVGEFSMDELAVQLRNEAANYAEADPSRPVVPAFELIATVAQRVPGADGTYILDTDHETLRSYIDYASENGLLVILDLQIGRGTVAAEIEKVRDLLALPNVHLALDPEFAVAEGQIPGEYIGSISAEEITYAQEVLAQISAEHGIPPKVLIVHQFREDMVRGKETLAPIPGVQLVIDADGYGAPELKTAVYNFLVRDEPVEFAGVKLFYDQDVPLMTPQEILALVPAPDVIIYQ